jgi:pimeloyl-ACP methyl ester carboxylesterase
MAPPPVAPDHEDFATAAGVRFHYVRYDPPAASDGDAPSGGRPILLIHGFPQTHYCWRLVAGPLAAATGRPVYAIDTKGNGESDKPWPDRHTPLGRYDVGRLSAELRALMDVLQIAPAAVVGHDWGGLLAWVLAVRYPEAVERLVSIDGPFLLPRNKLRMTYAALFQIPRLPEWIFRRAGVRIMEMGLRAVGAGGQPVFTRHDAEVYYAPLAAPGGIEAALAYYRSALRSQSLQRRLRRGVRVPTLLLWGDRDPALPLEVPRRMLREIPGGALAIFAHTGHWVPEERPAEVVDLIRDFLAGDPPPGRGHLIWTVP